VLPFDTVFTSWPQLIATGVVLAVAQALYVLFGFGGGLIAIGCLALVLPNVQDVVVMLVLVYLPAELYVVFTSRHKIAWRGVALICVGAAVGVPAGAWILERGEPTFILGLLAAFLIGIGVTFLLLPDGRSFKFPVWTTAPVGILAGVLGGMFGTGGPPVILYYQLSGIPKAVFRGSLMTIFLVVALVRLPSYIGTGLFTIERMWSSLVVLPMVLIGAAVGHRIHVQLSERTFRRLVSAFLVVVGLLIGLRFV
jgi:uncharacterized membrane protein YfcA